MKILILLAFAGSAWSALAVLAFVLAAMPVWAIGSAVLAVLLWFIAIRENAARLEREEDRDYYGHPRL